MEVRKEDSRDGPWEPEEFKMGRMMCGAQVHPEVGREEDGEDMLGSGHLRAVGALANPGDRWG